MAKFHINKKGEPAACRAKSAASCPLKNDNGEASPHFENKEDAAAHFEKTMKENLISIFEANKNDLEDSKKIKERMAQDKRIEEAVLAVSYNKTLLEVPNDKKKNRYSSFEHHEYYVHPDFRAALPDNNDLKEYLLNAKVDSGLSRNEREYADVSYDSRTGVLDVSYYVEPEYISQDYDEDRY